MKPVRFPKIGIGWDFAMGWWKWLRKFFCISFESKKLASKYADKID